MLLKRLWTAGVLATVLLFLCNVLSMTLLESPQVLTAFDPAILVRISRICFFYFIEIFSDQKVFVEKPALDFGRGYKSDYLILRTTCCLLRFA